MRDKQLIDRETREQQEQAWIYMMHGQAPPGPKRAQLEAASGMIPLAPMVDSSSSPLVAARAAAASMSWQAGYHGMPSSSSSWPMHAAPAREMMPAMVSSGMVKLEKRLPTVMEMEAREMHSPMRFDKPAMARSHSDSMRFPFAPSLAKPTIVRSQTEASSHTLLELLPKRKRSEEDEEYVDERDDTPRSAGGKRSCLPKKCDFPMCKNSSRSRGFCYSHGGGRRCRVEGCSNGAVSRDLCKRHGGGRRCRIPGCKSSSESGGLCYSHGGGRRCSLSWCNARAKKGGYCAVHLEHKDATPPPEHTSGASSPSAQSDEETPRSPVPVVSSQVVETLLALSKSPKDDEELDAAKSPTSPSLRNGSNPYALTSILN